MTIRLFLFFVPLLVFFSCGKEEGTRGPKIDDPIVGKWLLDHSNPGYANAWDMYLFRDNGTYASISYEMEELDVVEAYYEVDAEPLWPEFRYIAVFYSPTAPTGAVFNFRIKGNNMEMFDYNGSPHHYYRRITDWSETGLPEEIIAQLPK